MNRLRAGFLALLASTLLATTAARAATIDVTTLDDLVVDDNVCSLREAVNASYRAGELLAHTSSEARLKDYRDRLAAAMAVRLQFPGQYYERSAIVGMLSEMDGELSTQTPAPGAETVVRDNLLLDVRLLADAIDALPDEHVYLCDTGSVPACTVYASPTPPTPADTLPGVKQVHALLLQVLEQTALEIARLEARNVADGCIDGSSFDIVKLPEGVHVLSQGQLEITARIELVGAGDASIITGAGDRLLHVADHVVANVSDLQLQGGGGIGFANGTFASSNDCSFVGNENRCDGGAIYAGGNVTLENVLIADNYARDGGGIFVDLFGTLSATNVRFAGNVAAGDGGAVAIVGTRATFTDARFSRADLSLPAGPGNQPNTASGNGGAIYFNPQGTPVEDVVQYDAVPGNITLERALVFGNSAQAGSGIYIGPTSRLVVDPLLDYEETVNASLSIVNSTFGENIAANGGTIAYISDASQSGGAVMRINNITMLDNDGGTGTGGLRSDDPVPDVYAFSPTVVMANSLVMENTGAGDPDCDIVSSTDNLFNRNYFRDGSYPACPGLRQENSATNTNYELDPLAAASAFGYLVDVFDPVAQVYLPIYPADLTTEVRLVSRGAGTQETYRCAEIDQRGLDRLSFVDADCDVGAVEYQIGRRVDDRITIQVNQASCLVVTDIDTGLLQMLTANDVGDANYVQYSLEVLSVERAGASAVVASSDPAGYLAAWIVRHPPPLPPLVAPPLPQVVDITACPEYDAANPFWTSAQETIYFTPSANFHGETNVNYRLGWETATATDSGTVGGIAHITTESAGGFASDSLNIVDIGAVSPWFLLLSLLGLRGRSARPARMVAALPALLALLVVAGMASAADNVIYVNATNNPATDDPLVLETAAGDRRCTLREALETARNDTANLTRGDCVDGNEGPDIVELVYNPAIHGPDPSVVTLTVTLADTLTAYGSVTIRCPVDANPGLTCVIAGDGTFPLINSLGSIGIYGMTLQGGNAGTGNGGAINSYGAVSIRKSLVTDNEARIGGGIFLRGLYGDLSIGESTFDNNRSRGGTNPGEGGGAVAMTAGSQHKIEISSSTFTGNTSERQAAALNIKTTTTTVIANSTFSGNSSTMGSGAIDLSGASGTAILRNITVVNNVSGLDSIQFSALEVGTGPAQHRLFNSIVAANFDAGAQDRNCSDLTGVYLNSEFSLYGENPLAPTCPVGATDQILPAVTVFDASVANGGLLDNMLQANGFDFAHTHAPNNPLAAQGIIVDAGYNLMASVTENLVAPLDVSSPRCANVDQRGKTRTSGGRCDIGAYEDDAVTATPDVGSNRGRRDRLAVIDILANDTAPEGQECVPNRASLPTDPYPTAPAFNLQAPLPPLAVLNDPLYLPDPSLTESAIWLYYEDPVTPANPKVLCALVTFDPRDGEAVFLPLIPAPTADKPDRKLVDDGDAWDDEINTKSAFVLAYRDCNSRRPLVTDPCDTIVSTPYDLTDDWADALMSEVSARSLTYVAGDASGRVSVEGNISVSILNVPPFVYPEVVYVTPGDTVRVNVLANDIDYDAGIDPPPPNDPCSSTDPLCDRYFDVTRTPSLTANGINLDSFKVTSCVEKDDIEDIDRDGDTAEQYRRCGFGDVFVDQTAGVITWIPRNAFNPFSETITYQVTDYAYPKADTRSATLTIIMDRPVANGGAILGDDDLSDILGIDFLGATGNLFFAALGLAALRRRRR